MTIKDIYIFLDKVNSNLCRRFSSRLVTSTYFMVISMLLVSSMLGYNHYANNQVYAVYIEGVELGVVKDVREIELFVDDLVERCGDLYGLKLQLKESVVFEKEFRVESEPDLERVQDIIRNRVSFITSAYLINIDGEPFVPVADEKDLEEVVEILKTTYAYNGTADEGSTVVFEVKILEDLKLEACIVPPESILTSEDIVALLTDKSDLTNDLIPTNSDYDMEPQPTTEPITSAELEPEYEHEPEPESGFESDQQMALSSSAFPSRDTSQNPELGLFSAEQPATEPEGNDSDPKIRVQTVEEVTVIEIMPFEIEYVEDHNMYVNQSEITVEGVDGEREVVYHIIRENGVEVERKEVEEVILLEPETQIEAVGKKPVPLSGGGTFLWPVQGDNMVTQGFRPGHSGVDIHADSGTNVLAAADGVVFFDGWGGTQGNYLIINHGSYWTLYLHNIANLVTKGARVSRGQVIAKVGSTGRSSGPHLHFEVRLDDGTRNWHSYYQHEPVDPMQFFNR
jgi:hypothetical protein